MVSGRWSTDRADPSPHEHCRSPRIQFRPNSPSTRTTATRSISIQTSSSGASSRSAVSAGSWTSTSCASKPTSPRCSRTTAQCCDAIRATVDFVQGECSCQSSRLLGSSTTLVPIVHYMLACDELLGGWGHVREEDAVTGLPSTLRGLCSRQRRPGDNPLYHPVSPVPVVTAARPTRSEGSSYDCVSGGERLSSVGVGVGARGTRPDAMRYPGDPGRRRSFSGGVRWA